MSVLQTIAPEIRVCTLCSVTNSRPLAEPENDKIIVAAHPGKKRGRSKQPDTLPRMDVVHELGGDDLICPNDDASRSLFQSFLR